DRQHEDGEAEHEGIDHAARQCMGGIARGAGSGQILYRHAHCGAGLVELVEGFLQSFHHAFSPPVFLEDVAVDGFLAALGAAGFLAAALFAFAAAGALACAASFAGAASSALPAKFGCTILPASVSM